MRWSCVALGGMVVMMSAGAIVSAQEMRSAALGLSNEPREVPLAAHGPASGALRVLIAGMVHGHVDGFLAGAVKRTDVEIVAVAEPDRALFDAYAKKYGLEAKLYYSDLEEAIGATQP